MADTKPTVPTFNTGSTGADVAGEGLGGLAAVFGQLVGAFSS
ncbi:hypothetical protein [Rhodococcus sp. NPDC059234]